jgi:hypothetical protein
MTKPVFLVTVVAPAAIALPATATFLEPPGPHGERVFVERIRASNRREAVVLTRRMHPQCKIYEKVTRAPPSP